MWAYAAGKEKSFRNPALPGGVHQGIPATTPYLAGEKKGGVSEITHHIYGWEKGVTFRDHAPYKREQGEGYSSHALHRSEKD